MTIWTAHIVGHDTRRKATKNEPQGLNKKGKSQATKRK